MSNITAVDVVKLSPVMRAFNAAFCFNKTFVPNKSSDMPAFVLMLHNSYGHFKFLAINHKARAGVSSEGGARFEF